MNVHHVAISVSNLEESTEFYAKLGFVTVKKFAREDMGAKAVFIELDSFQIELWKFSDLKQNQDPLGEIKIKGIRHIAFEVDNLHDSISEYKAKGLKFTEVKLGASGHNYSFTSDPNGVALEFYEKKESKEKRKK